MSDVKKVLGYKIGDFLNDKGQNIHFVQLFCFYTDDNVIGFRCEKFPVADDSVLEGVQIGDFVELYFNEKQKVKFINRVKPSKDVLIEFGECSPVEE